MISLLQALAQTPSNGSLIWDHDCPNLERSALIPQADLLRLDTTKQDVDIVLFLPPISGHSSSLIQDLAKPVSEDFDTYVLDWNDPAFLYSDDADYGHECQVAGIQKAIETLLGTSRKVHVVSICQSAAPTLIALDAMQSPNLTLSLLAAPLFDGPGGVCDLFSNKDIAIETLSQVSRMTSRAINGTSILPGSVQLAAILNGSGGALRVLGASMTQEFMPIFQSNSASARMRRISLLDCRNIPEKLLIEGLSENFISRSHLTCRLDPRIPVHLMAGEADQVVPADQTFEFSNHFPSETIVETLFSGLDHFDLFAGSTARIEVSEKMKCFFRNPHAAFA